MEGCEEGDGPPPLNLAAAPPSTHLLHHQHLQHQHHQQHHLQSLGSRSSGVWYDNPAPLPLPPTEAELDAYFKVGSSNGLGSSSAYFSQMQGAYSTTGKTKRLHSDKLTSLIMTIEKLIVWQ